MDESSLPCTYYLVVLRRWQGAGVVIMKPLPGRMVIRTLASPWVSINHGHHATRSQHTVCLLQELARGHRWQLMQQIRACHEVEAAVLHWQ